MQKGFHYSFNKRTKRPELYVGAYEENKSHVVALTWPLATELGPSMRIKHTDYFLFTHIPEFFQALATFPYGFERSYVVKWLLSNGYAYFPNP